MTRAFGRYDVLLLTLVAIGSILASEAILSGAPPAARVLFTLLAHGILRRQLFDIDPVLTAGIGGTVTGGTIAGAALVGGEVIARIVGVHQLGGAVAIGSVPAPVFRPSPRVGVAIASRVLPAFEDTTDIRTDL